MWIVGDYEHFTAKGFKPLGMEPLAVGLTADADHIITPSREGPTTAIRTALAAAQCTPAQVGSRALHATATPGDFLEVENLRGLMPESVLVTARKGTTWAIRFVYDTEVPAPAGVAGKLSMGVGGLNACSLFHPAAAPRRP